MARVQRPGHPASEAAPEAAAVAELAELHRDAVYRATPVIEGLAENVRRLPHDEFADRVYRAFRPRGAS